MLLRKNIKAAITIIRRLSPSSCLSAEILQPPLSYQGYCCDSICEARVGKVRSREGPVRKGFGEEEMVKVGCSMRHITFLSFPYLEDSYGQWTLKINLRNASVYSKLFYFSFEQRIISPEIFLKIITFSEI